jgi:tetratricopeptide (TPR) repeat protein
MSSSGAATALALCGLLATACASFAPGGAPVGSFRLTDVADAGDPERRSSMQLVLQGLDDDADVRSARALSSYENALRVDPSNPYAYLALARHYVYGPDPERALPYLDKCHSLLRSQGAWSPRVEAHLEGLRGAALTASGRTSRGRLHLERARTLDAAAWGDEYLAASELR